MENSNSAQEAAWYCHEVVQMLATSGNVLETKRRSRSPNIYAEKCPEHCHVHAGFLESPLGSQSHFCKTERWYRTRDGQMQRLQRVLNSQYVPTLLQYLMGSTATSTYATPLFMTKYFSFAHLEPQFRGSVQSKDDDSRSCAKSAAEGRIQDLLDPSIEITSPPFTPFN